jgi:hypothetical protein
MSPTTATPSFMPPAADLPSADRRALDTPHVHTGNAGCNRCNDLSHNFLHVREEKNVQSSYSGYKGQSGGQDQEATSEPPACCVHVVPATPPTAGVASSGVARIPVPVPIAGIRQHDAAASRGSAVPGRPVDDPRRLRGPAGERALVYDLEVFQNHTLAVFTDGVDWRVFDERDFIGMARLLRDQDLVLIGYNNTEYDDLLARVIARDPQACTSADLYALSSRIIGMSDEVRRTDQVLRQLRWARTPWAYSIDLLPVLKVGGQAIGLKEHGCRMGMPLVAEAPVDFNVPLPAERRPEVEAYCRNDVETTLALVRQNGDLITMRSRLAAEYDLNTAVYSSAEPTLGQMTLVNLHRRKTGVDAKGLKAAAAATPSNTPEVFNLSDLMLPCIGFTTAPFQAVLADLCRGQARTQGGQARTKKPAWKLVVPDWPKNAEIELGGVTISMGMGGLHSKDAPRDLRADAEYGIYDIDATSFYPAIMIEHGLYPAHMGAGFLADLRSLRDRRVQAKRAGDRVTSDALKIVINSAYGKLNNEHSPLRSVREALRVTLNGQMMLLMLMEECLAAGAEILSLNTDGLVIRWRRSLAAEHMQQVMARWKARTRIDLEVHEYSRFTRHHVNCYVAFGMDGTLKTKGALNPRSGKRDRPVVVRAALAYLKDGVDPAVTIEAESDPVAFCYYQKVPRSHVLMLGDACVGTLARWYVALDGDPLVKVSREGKRGCIPHGSRARLALDMRGWTRADMGSLDLQHYIDEAWALITGEKQDDEADEGPTT